MKKFAAVLILLFSFLFFTIPAVEASSTGQLIIINKATNKLAYYSGGKLVKTFKVATGKQQTYTPEGKFKIVKKIVNRPYYKGNIPGGHPNNPLGDRWLGLDARGTYGTTYAIHGNNNPSSIGKYVSSGCVRMYDDEVRWLYSQVKMYTPVIIVNSSQSFDSIAASNGFFVDSKISKLTVSKNSPQPVNTALTLTASISQGSNTVYRFFVLDGGKWVTLRDYSSSKTVDWKPAKPGTYKIKVQVKSKNSKKTNDDERVITYNVYQPASLTSVKGDKAGPQPKGTKVAISAVSNSNANNQFKYSVYDGAAKKWSVIKNFSAATWINWTPSKPGQYTVKVEAKHKWAQTASAAKTVSYTIYEPAVLKSITPNKVGPQPVNTEISIVASSNKDSDHLFQYSVSANGINWTILNPYKKSTPKITWEPQEPGKYKIKVQVKHKLSQKTEDSMKEIAYEITPAVQEQEPANENMDPAGQVQ